MNKVNAGYCVNNPIISVIIPTTCEAVRSDLIERAIKSVKEQENVNIEILLVCNGNRQDQTLLVRLEKQMKVQIIRLLEGNVSKARYEGVRNARGEFYCFLDDDDQFLPGCLQKRLTVMERDLDCDIVVTNGFIHESGNDVPLVSSEIADRINLDSCMTFLQQNWFASPASMFRAKRINSEIFNFQFKYFEWTYLFFKFICLNKKFIFENKITYRKYEDNPLSISKTIEYSLAYPDFLLKVKQLDLPINAKAAIHKKYLAALNSQSNIYLKQGEWLKAWRSHFVCVLCGGVGYLSYTRHLLFPNSK